MMKHHKRNEPSSSRGESYSPTVIHPVHAVLDESENQFESIEGRFKLIPKLPFKIAVRKWPIKNGRPRMAVQKRSKNLFLTIKSPEIGISR